MENEPTTGVFQIVAAILIFTAALVIMGIVLGWFNEVPSMIKPFVSRVISNAAQKIGF